MPSNSARIDGLEELIELNRLFLISVRTELRRGVNPYALPPAAAVLMSRAPAEAVENLAAYPQALFELHLEGIGGETGVASPGRPPDPAARALNLTLLVSAWNMSRQSGYAARLFLRLSAQEIRDLRTTPLSDLPRLSQREHVVTCAFGGRDWLWCDLLTEARPEHRRRLLLVGLQPRIELNPSGAHGLSASI